MAFDPVTYISGGVGGAAAKKAMQYTGKAMLKGAGKEVAGRYAGRTMAGRLLGGAAGGVGNFATYNTLTNIEQQMRLGGAFDPETGEREFSGSEVLKSTLHGVVLGAATGALSPVIGNVADKWVKATSNTAGKVGIRAGELATSTIAEGTIFAAPEWVENAQLADDNPNKRSAMDIWTDNLAMMLGFKASHGIKSAPRVIAGMRPVAEPKTMEERNHNRMSFMERLRKQLDSSPRDLDLTQEEREELRKQGYGELADLFRYTPKQKPAKPQSEAKPKMTDGKTMTFDIVKHNGVEEVNAERVTNPEFDGYSAMEALMQDPTVSQSTRAKAYYILTGRQLPMGTVTGYTKDKDEHGNIYVKAVTANGEVVTNKRFADESSAKQEENNILRQAELNSVDVGERYKETAANIKVVQAAVEQVAPGADFGTVMRNYKAVKEGDADAVRNYGGMVRDIDKAIEANKTMADAERPEAIRAAIKEETGVDVDDAIKKGPGKRNEQEQAAVEDYIKRLYPVEKGSEAVAERPMLEEEAGASAIYDQSRLLWDKVEQGDAEAKADVDAIVMRMQEAYELCEDAFGTDAEWRMAEMKEDPWAMVKNSELTEDQQDAVLYYINAKAAMDGVQDASNDAMDNKRKEVAANVERHTHKDSGMVLPATMKVDDKPVYVVKGKVAVYPDGSGIDAAKSDQSIVICDAETGEYMFTSPDQIFNLGDAIDPQAELDEAYANIQAEHEAVLGGMENGESVPKSGESVHETPENVQNEGENVQQPMTDEQLQQYAQGAFNEATQGDGGVTLPREQVEQMQQHNQQMLEQDQQRREEEANRQPTALERVPLNEETGEPMFEKADKETALDALNEVTGGNEANTTAIVNAQVEQAQKTLDALKKKQPTKKAPSLKGSPMAMVKAQQEADANYNAAMEQYYAQVANAEETLGAWSRIYTLMNERKRAIREQQEAEQRERDKQMHDAAVAQVEEQKRMAAEKAAEQEAVGTHAVNPKIKAKWDGATKVEGNPNAITLADGSTIRGHYVLTEAGAATASHDVNNAYEPTEGFPVDENGESVNDRDYKRDRDAQRIVMDMADNYDSRALQTPVIVSKDGVVLSGNNRTMSGEIAAKNGTDKAYVDHLREFGAMFGFTPEQIDGMQHPRVVFVPDEELPYDANTFARFNAEQQKKQSKPEHAVKLGKIVPDNVFASIVGDISRFDRMSDYYADGNAVSSAIGQLLEAGVINEMQLPELRTGNALSAAGKELIENTLIGKVFQTSPDAVRQIISTPTLRQSVVMGLNEIANNRTLAKSGYDLSQELAAAVDLVSRAKSQSPDIYKDGMPVSPFGRQQGLFDDEYGDSRVTDGVILLLADLLNNGKPSELRKVLSTYNNEAASPASGQMDMFSGDVTSKEEILNNVLNHFRNATPREQQAIVDAAIAERKRRAEAGPVEGSQGSEQTENAVRGSEETEVGKPSVNDGRGDKGRIGERQGDLQPEEKVTAKLSSDKTDEYGKPLVIAKDGTTTFGIIDPESGLKEAPIQLSLGENHVGEDGKNHGYGLLHIEAGHGEQIRAAGFSSVEDFVEEVAKNYVDIREGAKIGDKQTYLLEVTDNHNNTLFVQLSKDGTYWNVNSAGIFNVKYSRRKPKVYSVPALGEDTNTDTSEVNSGHSDGVTAPAGNSSKTSVSKVINNQLYLQGNAAESVGGEGETSLSAQIEAASADVNTEPTEAQKEAGNYKKGHVQVGTFDITIEQPEGSVRKGTDADGKQWESKMHNTYGYIRGAVGVDGDHIDVFLSNDIDGWNGHKVFVVDQYNPDGTFDEHKVMLGFNDADEAKSDYLANYEKGWEYGRRIDVSAVNLEGFEKWIESSKRKTKPFGEYASVKKDVVEVNAPKVGYSITPSTYTNKKGKTSNVSLLTFDNDLTADQERAVKEFAKERTGEGRFAPARGWKDRESGGWIFRNEEDARKAVEMVGNEEAVADNQPMTAQELRDAVEPKKPTASKKTAAKKPANRVEVADVVEQKPSEPTKAEQPKQDGEKKLVITDEMKHDEDILRELLGIGDEELDGGIKFRDPDAMTSQQRRFVYNAGVNYSLGYIDKGFVAFPEFAKAMVGRLGYKIKPWLKSFYEGAKRIPGYDQAMFTPTEEVDAFDVENFDKPNKDVMAQAKMIVEEGKAQVAAAKANNELKATRNEQRKEADEQRAADTAAVAEKARIDISQAETDEAYATDGRGLSEATERVDDTLGDVNDQLALLGYYAADREEKDYNKAYGYMRNAEKKAVKDAAGLAEFLLEDLGLDYYAATHAPSLRGGTMKKKPLAVANIAPVGGDITIHLPLNEGHELYINIALHPTSGKGKDTTGDDLEVDGIMYRVEGDKYSDNHWAGADVTYAELLKGIERVAYKYLPGKAEAKEGEYYSGDKVEYSPDGGRTWHDAVVAQPNDEGGFRIDTGLAPAMWVNAHSDQLRHKAEARKDEDIFQKAERIASESRDKRAKSNVEKLKPIGKGSFGDVYNQFQGNAQEAFAFLKEKRSGDVLGVFRRDGVGNIDVVWGDKGGGLSHIIDKHVGEGKSFLSVDEAAKVIDSIIKTGDKDFENGDKIVFKKESKLVTIRKNVRDKGKKIADKNWILTAYDELSADGDVSAIAPNNQGQAARTTDISRGKGIGNSQNNQEDQKEKTTKKVKPEQQVGDLFAGLFDKSSDNGLQGNDASIRTEAVPADHSGQRQGLRGSQGSPRKTAAQEGGRPDGGRGGQSTGKDRAVSAGLHGLTEPKNTRNNHSERGADHAPTSVNGRIEANIKAIELAHELLESGETATPEQMRVLRQFSGWGGLGAAFSDGGYDWKQRERNKKMRELLGEEAYEQAVMSANSAYYTPAYVVDTLWDIAGQLGFKGGNILEGSAGIGNILGQMPTAVSERSDIHAIEIDGTSGGILSLLYPDAKVDIQGFEQTRIPNGSVDLAITNVPFVTGLRVNDTTGDSDLSKKFHNIHDFCIAKNVRKLREGGLGIFISSNGTLDNSKALRDWVVNEGGSDFIGAFRMNNKTFGGTTVTSDIIVIRKRVNGQKSAQAIDVSSISGERTAEYEEPGARKAKQLSMDYNKYFIEHPDHMAGEMRFAFEAGDTFRPTSKGLYPVSGKDQGKMLADFVKSFTEEERGSAETTESDKPIYVNDASAGGKKLGEMYLKDGKLVTAGFGGYYPLEVNDKKIKGHTKQECFTAYAAIKDALAEVMQYQTENEGDEGLKPLIAKLNKAYDAFVSTYGHFNKNNQLAWLRNDVDYPNVFSLETYKEQGDGKGGVVKTYDKADVMKGRVVEKESEPHPENVNDGVVVSMFKNGRIDVPYIASQLGKSEAEVKREIIDCGLGFEDPATRQMEVSYQYLSGNVREKLKQAEANNENGEYSKNIKALQDVVPMNIPAHLIDFTLGSSWLDPKLYDAYVKERTDIDVHFTAAGGTWFMKAPTYGVNVEKNRAMGIVSEKLKKTIMGHELISAAIQNKSIVVSRTEKHFDGTTGTVTDREATAACAAKIDEIRQDFKDWVRGKMQRDADLSARMEQAYNDRFNNYVPMSIPKDFVPEYFGGATHKFKMRSHQGKAIVRGTMQPLLLAHEVGTGKTFTLISTAMEMRRLGTARKPMIVVQNATVGQFAASAKELYPNAKVLVLDDNDRDAEGRKNFYAKIKYNDWDMVIIPQSTLDKIPDSDERQMQFKQDKIDEKMLVLEQMREADSSGRDPITRRAEKELADLQAEMAALTEGISKKRTANDEKKKAVAKQNAAVKAEEMLDRRTDDVENFDDMGIDALLIDEAHEYKHLGFATAMQRGVKGVDPSYSKKSQGVYLKTQAVLEKNNGRNVIFATGTPISNTAAEIWTFMRYLMPKDTMKEYGIYYFDDFVRNFGNLQQMMEFKTNGKFQEVNRFAGYVNLPELVRIWSGVADTALTKDQTELVKKIPEMEGGKAQDIYLPQTRALRSVMKYVREELERFDQMSGKEKKENSSIPLTMYGIAQGAAVDARLVEMHAEDDPRSKTNEAVRQTLRSLKETDDYKGTVAIFADHYQNKRSGFNLYEEIKKKLIEQGVPESEIVVMKSGMKIKQKLEVFDKVNRGEVRVILGSTATLGTGVNIQERLHTLIHLDAPNRPMDYTQRNGRILRQGNLHKQWNKPVRVLRFGVEDSLDVTAYQRLKTKGAIADSVMEGDRLMQDSMNNRVLEEEEDVFGDTVAQLSGSEYALLKNNAEKNVRKYESRKKQWEADQTYIHNAKPKLEGQIKAAEQRAEEANAQLLAVQKAFPDGKFTEITVGKLKFASVDAMTDFIKEYNKKILDAAKEMKEKPGNKAQAHTLTLSLGGYDFVVKTEMSRETVNNGGLLFAEIHRRMSYSCPELGLNNVPVKQSLLRNAVEDITENVITGRDFAERFDIATRMVQHGKSELEQLKQREGKPFEFGKELEEAKRQFEEYSEAMKVEMAEKEKKYAEMDASVEAASDVVTDDEDETAEDKTKFRLLDEDDPKATELESLPESELVPVYRNVQAFEDDALGSPMAFTDAETGERRTFEGRRWNYSAPPKVELTEEQQRKLDELNKNGYIMVDGKKSTELQINDGLKFVKPKTKDAQLQYFLKKNPEDKGLWAAYDPYDHAIETPLNTQFGEAYKRPNLVVVRSLIPKSEIDEPFHADYALLPTGAHQWNNGRTLYLSRWSKIDKVLTREEEAKLIDEYWKKHPGKREELKTHRDYNRFVPQVRRELEKMGYRFELDGKELTPEESLALDKQNWESHDVIPGREGHTPFVSNEDIARINAKMAGKWVGEPKEAMNNAMAERVNELAERLHTPVRIIRTDEEVAALPSTRQRRMKGSFNPLTGEVTIVVPNNANMADVENTFIHEVVGHDGLRVLFPEEEKLNNALDELYNVSKDEIRNTIDRNAQKMYDAEVDRLREKKRKEHEANGEDSNASYYADMAEAHAEASKKREQFKRDATEEYGADLAGRIGEKGFEKMSAEELTFWGKLKSMLQKALQKLLDGLKIPGKKKWGDKEWAFVLHEAYKRKKNGGKPDVFDAADTEVMRRKTGFGETKFSDGEREQQTANERFNHELTRYQNGEMDKNEMLHLGRPQGVMRAFLPNLPIVMRQRVIKKGSEKKHEVDVSAIMNMPQHLSSPIFVFQRSEDTIGVLTDMRDRNGKNVCVAIELKRQIQQGAEYLEVNDVRSFHGREFKNIVEPIANNKTLKWVDKEKGLTYLSSASQPVQQEIDKQVLDTATKVVKDLINPKVSDNNVADEGVMFRDGDMGLEETITKMKVEASQANADNWQAKQDAMRAIGGNLNKLRQAMARQRAYDLWTVKSVTDLAQILLDNGLLDDMSKYEYNRILSAVKNVHGKKDISKYVDKVMDVMVGNQLRAGETRLGRLERIRASKVDAKGIDVQGQLDADGQVIMNAFRSAKPLSVEELDKKILEATDRMSNTNEQIAANAALEHTGLLLAKQYVDGVSESKKAVAQFKDEVKKAEEEMNAGQMTEEAFKQFKDAIDETIKQLKIDRIEAYNNLADSLGGVLGESVERAKQWKEAEKERVNKIHHLANSDMQGRELKGHRPDTKVQWLANSWVARFAFEPLSTFDQMLKMFGSKNPNGEGYMQDYFMRHWIDSTDNEQLLKERYQKQMDDKAAEIFGKKYKYLDLYGYVQTQKSATVKYYDGADMREYEIAQDGLLYLYAVEKMPMGKATNRRMGITDETMEKITDALDPKLKEFADWVQEDFLPSIGMESDVVYTRMFGTHMDSIEKYFPFVRDKDALKRDVENGQSNSDNDRISVQTGAIKKRVASVALWNLKDMSFLDVLAKHVGEMSHWQSFAELNRDIGTLLSYNRFKQQVMNMSSVYGSGKELWKRFEQCAAIATDCYEPQRAKFDRLMVQGAKGVTMGKIAFRPFTALKQTLSLPAFFGEVNAIDMAEALATCGIPALKWSWNNMPNFRKRILSRTTGDYRLRETEYDSKIMKAASYGMLPNIGVDAWTIAVGSHCVYKAQKRKYLRWGMEEERAERRAVQDAEMCFNKSQQSSEGAYMAPIQIDHTFYATSAMLFRNSSTAYTRETHNSARNLKRIFSGEVSEDYVTKQILRTIHPNAEDYWSDAEWAKARAEAKREIRSAKVKNGVNLVMFGWILPWLWRIGGTSVLLALTGDNEERAKQLIDATKQSVFAPMEGLTYGDVFEGGINKVLGYTEQSWSQQGRENPMISDMKQMLNELDYDWVQATNDVLNILGGMTTGVNPQTFTDWAVAIMDFCGDDAKTSRECALLAARLLNCPQSQLDKVYLEELDMTAAEAKGMTPAEVAERYARYKMMREAPLTGWMRSAEKSDSISAKKQNKVFTIAKEKLNSRMETEETKQLLSDYDAVAKQKTALSKIKKTDRAAYREGMKQLRQSNDMRQHMRLKRYKHDMNELTSKYLRCKSAEERDSIVSTMFSTRAKMLEDIGRMKQQ